MRFLICGPPFNSVRNILCILLFKCDDAFQIEFSIIDVPAYNVLGKFKWFIYFVFKFKWDHWKRILLVINWKHYTKKDSSQNLNLLLLYLLKSITYVQFGQSNCSINYLSSAAGLIELLSNIREFLSLLRAKGHLNTFFIVVK